MSTENKPLLSDERIADRVNEYILPYRIEITRVANEFRDEYEQARAKDRELIQQLVDAAYRMLDPVSFAMTQTRLPITEHEYRSALMQSNAVLAAAKAEGYTPTPALK